MFLDIESHKEVEYGCPRGNMETMVIKNLLMILEPFRMAAKKIPMKEVRDTVNALEIYLDELSHMVAIFNNYKGNNYCKGLLFGMHGAAMLKDIAREAISANGLPNMPKTKSTNNKSGH